MSNSRSKTCFTCRTEKDSSQWRSVAANIEGGNTQHGEILKMVGVDVGYSKSWHYKQLCVPCYRLLNRWYTLKLTAEELSLQWYEKTNKKLPTLNKSLCGHKFKEKAVRYLGKSEYGSLVRLLLEASPLFKQSWEKEIQSRVKKEMSTLIEMKNLFPVSNREAHRFDWDDVLEHVRSTAPTVFNVFKAAMMKNPSKPMSQQEKRRMGTMVLVPVFHRRPRLHRFLPALLSTSLWRSGTKGKIIDAIHGLGIGITVRATRSSAERLAQDKNQVLQDWCETIQNECKDEGASAQPMDVHPSYALALETITWPPPTEQVKKDKKRPSRRTACSGYAAKNRVSCRGLSSGGAIPASEIPIGRILPSQADYESLKSRMMVIVQRILANNLKCFEDVADAVQDHIPHTYSDECAQMSECVSLGVIQVNPYSASGIMAVLSELGTKVPNSFRVPLYGNKAIMETIANTKVGSCTLVTRKDRLSEFQAVPQDVHLRSLIMKDTMTQLYSPTSPGEIGSLRQLKDVFKHDGVNEAMTSFNLTDDFLLCVCCLLVVGFALDQLNLTCDDVLHVDHASKFELLTKTAEEVVSRVWNQASMNSIADIINAPVEGYNNKFCICKGEVSDESSDMIECGNMNCERGRWFHTDCLETVYGNEDGEEGDLFCSEACAQSGHTSYCVCRLQREEPLSLSCANAQCPRGKVFHEKCVASQALNSKDGHWYCSFQCQERCEVATFGTEDVDHLLLYLETCAWRCLLNEAMRDAVREGDGLAMMSHWRILFPELFRKEHTQFLGMTHRLLTGISGCFPERIREEVIHNRTVNLAGGAGQNESFDPSHKHQSKNFNNARVEQSAVQDAANVSRVIAEEMEEIFLSKVSGVLETSRGQGKTRGQEDAAARFQKYREEVRAYLDRTESDNLFSYQPGRVMRSMGGFRPLNDLTHDEAQEMKSRIVKLNSDADIEMELGSEREKENPMEVECPVVKTEGSSDMVTYVENLVEGKMEEQGYEVETDELSESEGDSV